MPQGVQLVFVEMVIWLVRGPWTGGSPGGVPFVRSDSLRLPEPLNGDLTVLH